MPYFSDVRNGYDVARFARAQRHPTSVLTEIEGLPVIAARAGGQSGRPVLVKAGSHASEIGAIHGALTLLQDELDFPFSVHVIPCASPFDFAGYAPALRAISGREMKVDTDAECRRVLKEVGRLIFAKPSFELYRVGEVVFAYVDQSRVDPRAFAYGGLDELSLADPRLSHELAGRRVMLPNFIYHPEDYGPYDHAGLACWANWDGTVGNPNRFYDSYDPPAEVRHVRELCERLQPGLVIDLHESGQMRGLETARGEHMTSAMSHGHFLVLPPVHGPCFDAVETPVALAMLEATASAGFACHDRQTLEGSWGFGRNTFHHGYVRCDQRPIIPFYMWGMRYPASIVVETGMGAPVSQRAAIHAAAVLGALRKYAALLEEGVVPSVTGAGADPRRAP